MDKYQLEVNTSEICRSCLARNCTLNNLFCNEIVDGEIVPIPSVYSVATDITVRH